MVMPNGVFSVVIEAEDRAGVRSNAVSNPSSLTLRLPKL